MLIIIRNIDPKKPRLRISGEVAVNVTFESNTAGPPGRPGAARSQPAAPAAREPKPRPYQRSNRLPTSAPTAVTAATAMLYQVRKNSGESSTQWRA